VLTDQAVAGNDVESTPSQLSTPLGAVHVTQVETVSNGKPVISPSEEIASLSTGTRDAGRAGLSVSAAGVCKPVNRDHVHKLPDSETKQRYAAVNYY